MRASETCIAYFPVIRNILYSISILNVQIILAVHQIFYEIG